MKNKIIKIVKYLFILICGIWCFLQLLSVCVVIILEIESSYAKAAIDINMLSDRVHNTSDKKGLVFDDLPGFILPTNVIIRIYSRDEKCRWDRLNFAFYVPDGDIILPSKNVEKTYFKIIEKDDLSLKRKKIKKEISYFYKHASDKNMINRIPKFKISTVTKYIYGIHEDGGKHIDFYIIKEKYGTYFYGTCVF